MMIGAFDSGHGGLTVLRALTRQLPEQSFLYLGDHAFAPYGDRPAEEIFELTVARVEQLFRLDCRLVILACNTASAVALRRLQQTWLPHAWPGRRVLGVLVPMVEAITGVPWMADVPAGGPPGTPRTVAVFATQRTVSSEAYPREISKRSPEVHVVQQACPHLARLIEEGAAEAELEPWVRLYVAELLDRLEGRAPDAAVLGCTHYPLIEHLFRAALPAGVDLLSQPDLVARSLAAYLERHPEFAGTADPGTVRFLTTGDAARVEPLARRFYGAQARFAGIAATPPQPVFSAAR